MNKNVENREQQSFSSKEANMQGGRTQTLLLLDKLIRAAKTMKKYAPITQKSKKMRTQQHKTLGDK